MRVDVYKPLLLDSYNPYPSALNVWTWDGPEQLGLNLPACILALDVFVRRCANGVSLHSRIVSVVPLNTDLRHFGAAKSHRTFRRNIIGTGQNPRRSKSAQKKNEPTWLYSALIKKNSYAKLIVLRLMITRYIGNMIVFLR